MFNKGIYDTKNYEGTAMKRFVYYLSYLLCFYFIRPSRGIQIEGEQNIPMNQSFIVVANHTNPLDPWIISSVMPPATPIHWFTNEKLYDKIKVREYLPKRWRDGLIGSLLAYIAIFVIKHSYTIKVAPQSHENISTKERERRMSINNAAIREAKNVLSQPKSAVGIFAQRGRKDVNDVNNISSSCLLLARKNDALILPVRLIDGCLTIMPPVDFSKTAKTPSGKKERARAMTEITKNILPQTRM